ncbi:MAG TPA: N-acetyltransferase [Nitrospira sp.]|nr:N-acetyltransferase [Nitrospira sp.]
MMSADQLRIRQATLQDLDVLTTFSAAMALETEHRHLDLLRLRLGTQAVMERPERGQYYVADLRQDASADTVTIGQLLITYEWSDWRNAQFWWIQSVYVDPAWRHQGVYRAMHGAVMTLAQSRADVCGVRLYVEGDNTIAQGVYERVGLTPSSYRIFESDFVLTKPSPSGHQT